MEIAFTKPGLLYIRLPLLVELKYIVFQSMYENICLLLRS